MKIGEGILKNQLDFIKPLASRFVIITDQTISELYGTKLQHLFSSYNLDVNLLSFPAGEHYKTRETKETLENEMLDLGCGRDTCILAVGGGVVTDLAGYVAATYARGLPLVLIPTSLLGMVDAGIGGKTGVNVPQGKNLLGAIYQPKRVIADLAFLETLPKKELLNGVVEMIKHGLIADKNLFEFLSTHSKKITSRDTETLQAAIHKSCCIKKEIVEFDERESGKRHLLNFGHTIAHALETLTNYNLSHGEAVALGILAESYLAQQMKSINKDTLNQIIQIFKLYELPLQLPSSLSKEQMMSAMTRDKKSLKGKPRFVIIDRIGSAKPFNNQYCSQVEDALLHKTLEWMEQFQ